MDNRPFTAHVEMKVETVLAMTDRELVEWRGEPVGDARADLERQKAEYICIRMALTTKILSLVNA